MTMHRGAVQRGHRHREENWAETFMCMQSNTKLKKYDKSVNALVLTFTNHATLLLILCLFVLSSIEGDNWLFTRTTAGQYSSPYLPSMGECFILSLNGIRHYHPVRI